MPRKYSLNENFFETINTPEKAYWLGFVTADGCIGKNRHGHYIYLSIALQRRDRDHLQKWADAIGYSGPVHDYASYNKDGSINEYSKLTISSQKIATDLRRLGVSERKSLIVQPWRGPKDLKPHYFRGLMDGDGNINIAKDGRISIRLAGTKSIVEEFQKYCQLTTGTQAKVFPQKNIFGLAVSGTLKAGGIVKDLYRPSCVALTRKNDIARVVIGKFECASGVN